MKRELAGLKKAKADVKTALEAQQILQAVAQAVQNRAHEQVAKIVGRCLRTVFDRPYEFFIDFRKKRGKTEAKLRFTLGGEDVDPVDEDGGGVLDVAAFALRLANLLMAVPKKRRLLVLDEPLKMLSRDHGPRVRELIEMLSRELRVQIVMVTHDPNLVAGKVVRI